MRREGATYAGIARSIINPQTGRHYTAKTVRNWLVKGTTPMAQKKVGKRLETIVRNVRAPPSKRRRKYTKKLGVKEEEEFTWIGGPIDPPIEPPLPPPIPIDELDLTDKVYDEIRREDDGDFAHQMPSIYVRRGHLKLEVTKLYKSYNPDIGVWDAEIEAFKFEEFEIIRTINRFSYPEEARAEMESRIKRKFETYRGQIGSKGSPKPILIKMIIHSLFWVKKYTNVPIDNTYRG